MGVMPFVVVFTFLVMCVNCARKSRMEQKFDALDNLVQSKLFLMGEELKTGQIEREVLMEKYNETIATLETQCKTNRKSFTKSGIEQSDLDMLNNKLEELLEKVKDNDKETEKQSDAFLRFKQGIKQEKLARKTNIEAVNERIQKSQNETKQTINQMQNNQNQIQDHLNKTGEDLRKTKQTINQMQENQSHVKRNINVIQENLHKTEQTLDQIQENQNQMWDIQFKMQNNLTKIHENFHELQNILKEIKEFQSEMKTKQSEIIRNLNTVTNDQNQLASQVSDLIQDVKDLNAPKLYCNNQLRLEACLKKIVTRQQKLVYVIGVLHNIKLDGI